MPTNESQSDSLTKGFLLANLRFKRNIESLTDLAAFTRTFAEMEYIREHLISFIVDHGDAFATSIDDTSPRQIIGILERARHELIRFSVGSDPKIDLKCLAAWLALMLTTIVYYDRIKANVGEMEKDVAKLELTQDFEAALARVEGLSDRSRIVVESEGKALCNTFLEASAMGFDWLAEEARIIKKGLTGSDSGMIKIKDKVEITVPERDPARLN
jgi:hypothetical protein